MAPPMLTPQAAMWGGRQAQVEQDVPVADVVVGDRLRPVGEGAVADLMVSIRETGLIQPIVLRPVEADDGEIGLV
ncbi:MAG: ParB N-terminal domain-containing protein, partial [Phenylobacterium sp.]|nr:ParB N-terminal domain-containing protein [Phenylobacterium sp.]